MVCLRLKSFLSAAIIVGLIYMTAVSGEDWNYIRGDAKGPAKWAELFPTCGGAKNSPINLEFQAAVKDKTVDWVVSGYKDKSVTWKVKDQIDTVKFELEEGEITLAGGGLNGGYDLIQFHFHWGAENDLGSEHLEDGNSYPLELHLVHKSQDFTDISAAVESGNSDALAVLGFFFQIVGKDNDDFQGVVDAVLSTLTATNNEVSEVSIGSLESFLEESISKSYYRYGGGLTTPTCNEVVAWTVFTNPIKISQSQMDAFRLLKNDLGTEKYRPVQVIGDRTVTLYL